MNPIAVFRSMHHELARNYNLPFSVTLCVKSLSVVHWMWWFYRKRQLVKPENIVPAALGTALAGGMKFTPNIIEKALNTVAKMILLATRIDECILSMQSLARSFTHLKEACLGKFPLIVEPQWVKSPESMVFSVHTVNQWRARGKEFKSYMRRIYYSVLSIFVKIFKLSMRLWDTYHAFVYPHDAIPEVFISGMYWYRKIRDDKAYTYAKLEQYQTLIQNILDATRCQTSANNLVNKTKSLLENAVKGAEKIEDIHHLMQDKIAKPARKIVRVIHSKLLSKDLKKTSIHTHTPFVLKVPLP